VTHIGQRDYFPIAVRAVYIPLDARSVIRTLLRFSLCIRFTVNSRLPNYGCRVTCDTQGFTKDLQEEDFAPVLTWTVSGVPYAVQRRTRPTLREVATG